MLRTYLKGAAALGLVALLAASGPVPAQERPVRAVVAAGSAPAALAAAQEAGGYLGVTIVEVDDEAVERLVLSEQRGALVQEVVDESPAAEGGVEEDDVVLRWDGEAVRSAAQLSRLVRETPPGREVGLEVHRDGGRRQLTVEVGERPGRFERAEEVRVRTEEARERMREQMRERRRQARERLEETREARERARVHVRRLRDELGAVEVPEGDASFFVLGGTGRMGVRLQSLSDQLAEHFGVGERKGALVSSVREDSPAAAAGLRAGDVIVGFGEEDVSDPGDVARAVRRSEEGTVSVTIVRDGQERSLTVELPEADQAAFDFRGESGEGWTFRFPSGEGRRWWFAPSAPGVHRIDVEIPDIEIPELPVDLRSLEMPEIEIPLVPAIEPPETVVEI